MRNDNIARSLRYYRNVNHKSIDDIIAFLREHDYDVSKECIFNCNKRFKNLWLQFFLSQNQGFMRLFEKTVLK